ncbi:MAG: hypothetical protein PHI78_03585 [Clostridia bacterium]|nr:hypothetical protein [Clostridia bacterium]
MRLLLNILPQKNILILYSLQTTLIKDSYSIYLSGVFFDEFTIYSINPTVSATSGMGGKGGQPRP